VVLPTPYDVIQLVKHTRRDPAEFVEFITHDAIDGVAKNDPTWLECGDERYLMALQRDSRRGCVFLDRKARACGVYEARPILCRLYPFKLDETHEGGYKGFSLHRNVECPKHKDAVVETAPLRAMYLEDDRHQQDYRDLVAVFNRNNRPGRRPEAFLNLFIERRGAPAEAAAQTAEKTA
jgi:Fe-S-cluster containining protein